MLCNSPRLRDSRTRLTNISNSLERVTIVLITIFLSSSTSFYPHLFPLPFPRTISFFERSFRFANQSTRILAASETCLFLYFLLFIFICKTTFLLVSSRVWYSWYLPIISVPFLVSSRWFLKSWRNVNFRSLEKNPWNLNISILLLAKNLYKRLRFINLFSLIPEKIFRNQFKHLYSLEIQLIFLNS